MSSSHAGPGLLQRTRIRLRPPFVITFTVGGLLAVTALAVVLYWVISRDVRDEQLRIARQSAGLVADASIAPRVAAHPHGLDAASVRVLDNTVATAQNSGALLDVVVHTRAGRIVYALDHTRIGRREALARHSAAALADDRTITSVQTVRSAGTDTRRVVVDVPVIRNGARRPVAAIELQLSHQPVADAVRRQVVRVELILIGAALLFFAGIWPRVKAASRAARAQSDPKREILVRELEAALKAGELDLHYQPIVDLESGRVSAMESFVRWRHPRHGLLMPGEFLPAAAASQLVGPLTVYIVERALRDCRSWRDAGFDAGVHVNLSEANVLDPRLPDEVGRLLGGAGIPAHALCLELTEKAIAADPAGAAGILARLDDMSVRISIDDFGTGYSSLAGLRDLPVCELKIDRSFISGLASVDRDAAITRSIIGLAHEIGVRVIAEGVEDHATLELLHELECDGAQGYLFSAALPLAGLLGWLASPTLRAPGEALAPA
jgi:EAL domain-containing protein (putative c-di-GMP-specific phosphodiesterase class I)